MSSISADDIEFHDLTVEKVELTDGGWYVSSGWGTLWVKGDNCPVEPKVGESFRMYGRGMGYTVRGVVIGGRVYRYQTAAEERASHALQIAERKKAQRYDDYESKRGDFDARVEALPEPFQLRIKRFREVGGAEWSPEFEPYELFVCEQAAALAATDLDIAAFHALPYEEQKAAFPAMADGHSGNTFGTTCLLARVARERPEFLSRAHGALCPLVGCDDYGCWAARKGEVAS